MNLKPIKIIRLRVAIILTLAMLLLMTAMVLAQSRGDFSLSQWTINNGSGTSNGGSFAVSATLGQPDAGALMSGGQFGLKGGFAPPEEPGVTLPPTDHDVYLPMVLVR